jgi:outer membrane assembly lipoprotein YfiO
MPAAGIAVALALVAAIGLGTQYVSPKELKTTFDHAQRMYGTGDYEQAIEKYQEVLEVKDSLLMDSGRVETNIADFYIPVKMAAAYQLGNSYKKLGSDLLKRAEKFADQGQELRAEELTDEGIEALLTAVEFFTNVTNDPNVFPEVRTQAQFQIVESNYDAGEFEEAVSQAQLLLERFPGSEYVDDALYTMGWSYFNLRRYDKSIDALREMVNRFPGEINADRAQYQIGESYFEKGDYDEARTAYDVIATKYDFSKLTREQLRQMESEKTRGVVQETARELAAKAQIKIGETYANQGRVDEAIKAYRMVIGQYTAERDLVRTCYKRIAELELAERGTEAGIKAYKAAITAINDPLFQAQMQTQVMRIYYESGDYEQAAREYELYIRAYPEVADRIGFGMDRAVFRLAECYKEQARVAIFAAGEVTPESRTFLNRASQEYQKVLDRYSLSDVVPYSLFGLAYVKQTLGTPKDIDEAGDIFSLLADKHRSHSLAPASLLQAGRVRLYQQRYDDAIAEYEKLVERYPQSGLLDNKAYIELGITYDRAGRADEALETLAKVTLDSPKIGRARIKMSELEMGRGNFAEAERLVEEVIDQVTEVNVKAELYYQRGMARFSQGDHTGTVDDLTRVIDGGHKPELVESAYYARAVSYFQLGEASKENRYYEWARRDLERVVANPDVQRDVKDTAFRMLGISNINLGRAEGAIKSYRVIIENTDDLGEKARFQLLLTELYYDMRQFDEAIAAAKQVSEWEFPDDVEEQGYSLKEKALYIVGDALMRQGWYEDALDALEAAYKKYPDSAYSSRMLYAAGVAAFQAQFFDDSARLFGTFTRKFPGDDNMGRATYYLGHSHQAVSAFTKAANAFTGLIRRFPNTEFTEESMFLIGENHFNNKTFDEALEAYQSFLKRFPDGQFSATAQDAIAWSWFELKDSDKALEALETLQERYPDSEFGPRAQFTIGDYYYNTRQYEEAAREYQEVIDRYPESTESKRARALIKELSEINSHLAYVEVMELFDAQQWAAAAEGFMEISGKYPGTDSQVAALCNLGMSYEHLRRWREAVEAYNQTLEVIGNEIEHIDAKRFAEQHRDWIVENRL